MKKTSFWLGILLAIILTIPSAVSAQQKVRGVTDTEIVIGWNTPLSGPAALWGVTGLGGKAWLDYINDQGGIHGRKIKVILKDDGYNPARAARMARPRPPRGPYMSSRAWLTVAITPSFIRLAINSLPLTPIR